MLERLIVVSAVLFCIGLYGALSRRHLIGILISIELMFNAVNLAFITFSRYIEPAALRVGLPAGQGSADLVAGQVLAGQTFAVFVIVIAAAEVARGLALVIALVRRRDTVDVRDLNLMRR